MRPTRPYVEFVRLAALAYYVLAEFVDPKRECAEAVGRAVVGQTRLCAFALQRHLISRPKLRLFRADAAQQWARATAAA